MLWSNQIPLSHFSSEEVKTWSALNSPRVVELFGAVRDGLNVILFMDLKPGKLNYKLLKSALFWSERMNTTCQTFPACLAQLLKGITCLPEDLALHYLHQTLGALEHLHHKKVVHLDVKGAFLSKSQKHNLWIYWIMGDIFGQEIYIFFIVLITVPLPTFRPYIQR